MQTLIRRQTLLLCAGLCFKFFILCPLDFSWSRTRSSFLYYFLPNLNFDSHLSKFISYENKWSIHITGVHYSLYMHNYEVFFLVISHNELPFCFAKKKKKKNWHKWKRVFMDLLNKNKNQLPLTRVKIKCLVLNLSIGSSLTNGSTSYEK